MDFVNLFNTGISNKDCFIKTKPFKQCEGTAKLEMSDDQDAITAGSRSIYSFYSQYGISFIDIIKIDTKGHKMMVIEGAKKNLSKGCVSNIVAEASIFENDLQHTFLENISSRLGQYGYRLNSFYDISHKKDGLLCCLNALFIKGVYN